MSTLEFQHEQIATLVKVIPPQPPFQEPTPLNSQSMAIMRPEMLNSPKMNVTDECANLKDRLAACEIELRETQEASDQAVEDLIAKERELTKTMLLLDDSRLEITALRQETDGLSSQLEKSLDISEKERNGQIGQLTEELQRTKDENCKLLAHLSSDEYSPTKKMLMARKRKLSIKSSAKGLQALGTTKPQAQDAASSPSTLETRISELEGALQSKDITISQIQAQKHQAELETQLFREQLAGQEFANNLDENMKLAKLDHIQNMLDFFQATSERVAKENKEVKEENRNLLEAIRVNEGEQERQKKLIIELYEDIDKLERKY